MVITAEKRATLRYGACNPQPLQSPFPKSMSSPLSSSGLYSQYNHSTGHTPPNHGSFHTSKFVSR